MSAPDVVAVVVSHGTRDHTLRCIESVLATAGELEHGAAVVVVDNASPDGTPDAVRERFGDRVTLIEEARNTGFGAACNRGAAAFPGARHVAVLNSDTELLPGALAALVATLDAADDVGIAAPVLVDIDGEHQPSVRGHPAPLALLHQHTALRFLRVGSASYARYKRPPREARADRAEDVPVVMGAAFLARGEDFRALGGFDPRYFLYFEEADLCRRMAERGRKVRLAPAATVRHEGGASSERDRERALVWYLASLFQYVDRFHGRGTGLLYRAFFKPLFLVRLLTDALRDLVAVVTRPSRREDKRKELALSARFVTRGMWTFLGS